MQNLNRKRRRRTHWSRGHRAKEHENSGGRSEKRGTKLVKQGIGMAEEGETREWKSRIQFLIYSIIKIQVEDIVQFGTEAFYYITEWNDRAPEHHVLQSSKIWTRRSCGALFDRSLWRLAIIMEMLLTGCRLMPFSAITQRLSHSVVAKERCALFKVDIETYNL